MNEEIDNLHAHHEIHEGNCQTCYLRDVALEKSQAENKRLRSFAEHRLKEFGECFCEEINGKCEVCLAEEALKSEGDEK